MDLFVKFLMGFTFLVVLVGCDAYEFPKSQYPRVETRPVTFNSATSVTLHGNLVQRGQEPIIQHGFIWGFVTSITESYNEGIITMGPLDSTREFDSDLSDVLETGKTYYVRSYVKTNTYIVYGNPVDFIIK